MLGRSTRKPSRFGERRRPSRTVVDERRVMPVSKVGASCVPFLLTVVQHGDRKTGEVRVTANTSSGRYLGEANATWNPKERSLDIFHASVPEMGCGVGTRLYEAMAAEACARTVNLRSDTSLSPYSKGFWKKQERKGRARWDAKAERFVLDHCTFNLEGRKRRR